MSLIRSLVLIPVLALSAHAAEQADFNAVGKQMAIMLQNSHFARLPYNEELGGKFLATYLKSLDSQKLYFTRQDIDEFSESYGKTMHSMLLQGRSIPAAQEMYARFLQRVEQRVAYAERILDAGELDFTAKDSVMISRKDADWPENDEVAQTLWRNQIKDAVLSEILRREMLTKMAQDQGKADPGKNDRQPVEKVKMRYKRFLNSVKDADEEDIANYFLSSVARTYDPHTDYMSFREMNRFRDGMKNELIGIGALLQAEEDGATKIMGIVVGGPADKEGTLKLNDRVVGVDSLNTGRPEDMVDIMFMTIDKVVDLIRGKEGTTVALKVEPAAGPSGSTRIVRIRREKVEMKDEQASGELIEIQGNKNDRTRLGVITLPSFYADFEEGKVRSSVDVEKILQRLVEEKMDGLVLDLRNNGGGSLEEVRRMTGFFMERGPVVQVKNTLGQIQVKDSENGKPIYGGPMIVLTDKSSASASEILAGALQDFNRAVIVGESSTFGKGTVQQPMDIGRMLPLFAARNKAGHLKVTIQKFYRPSGSSTQMQGVVSDIVLPSVIDALDIGEAFLDNALAHDRIRRAADFRPLEADHLFIPALREKSLKRVSSSKDFEYIIADVMEAKDRIKRNQLSLQIDERRKILADADRKQMERNSERKTRFEEMRTADRKTFVFHKLTLDDVDGSKPLKPINPDDAEGEFMRRAKSETEELDDTPEWPSGLDPMKREGLMILQDLVEMTGAARVAGVMK